MICSLGSFHGHDDSRGCFVCFWVGVGWARFCQVVGGEAAAAAAGDRGSGGGSGDEGVLDWGWAMRLFNYLPGAKSPKEEVSPVPSPFGDPITVIRSDGKDGAWWIGLEGRCGFCRTEIKLNRSVEYSAYFCVSWEPRWVRYPCPTCEAPITFEPPTIHFYRMPFSTIGVPSRLHSPEVEKVIRKLQELSSADSEVVLSGDESEVLKRLFDQPDLWAII